MGEPVRIADVARRLVDEADRTIEIVYTGLRPGEKLHEVLAAERRGPAARQPPAHRGASTCRPSTATDITGLCSSDPATLLAELDEYVRASAQTVTQHRLSRQRQRGSGGHADDGGAGGDVAEHDGAGADHRARRRRARPGGGWRRCRSDDAVAEVHRAAHRRAGEHGDAGAEHGVVADGGVRARRSRGGPTAMWVVSRAPAATHRPVAELDVATDARPTGAPRGRPSRAAASRAATRRRTRAVADAQHHRCRRGRRATSMPPSSGDARAGRAARGRGRRRRRSRRRRARRPRRRRAPRDRGPTRPTIDARSCRLAPSEGRHGRLALAADPLAAEHRRRSSAR